METTSLNAVPKSFAISEMDPRDEQFPRILSGEFRPKVESPAYNISNDSKSMLQAVFSQNSVDNRLFVHFKLRNSASILICIC